MQLADAFATACGVSLGGGKRQLEYLRTRKLTYTETGPASQVLMYTRLWKLYAAFTAAQR